MPGGYASFADLIKDKSKKLLFPFIAVLLFYAVPIKAIAGFYANSTNVFKDILINEVLIQKSYYLWYLPVLFLIFAIHYCLEKKMHIKMRYKLAAMVIASCAYNIFPINALRLVARDILWFYVGYCFAPYREMIDRRVYDRPVLYIILSGVAFTITSVVFFAVPNPIGINMLSAVSLMIKVCCAATGCVFVYNICALLSLTGVTRSKVFIALRTNAFGMYLYSDPWNYVVLAVLVHCIGRAVFVANYGSAVMFVSRVLVTGGVSLAVSSVLKKLGIKYIC